MEIIIQVIYCIGISAMVTIGCLLGILIVFCLFGYTCMAKPDMVEAWKSLWKARVK